MEIIYGIENIKKKYRNPVVAIGVFDGLHKGHKRVIQKTIREAKAINGTAVVMTFAPHPVHVLRPQVFSPLIISLQYRLRLIEELGIDLCVVIRFTKELSLLTPEEFVKYYLVDKIHPKVIIVGEDFRFGIGRCGQLDCFRRIAKKYRFNLRAVSIGRRGKKSISSTTIRQLITEGRIFKAGKLLGRPVSILGRVIHGDARGSSLGYPTANILPSNEIIPPSGVYLVNILFRRKKYNGMANVGRRPSFKRISKVNVEVHIFKFNKNIYGQDIIVEFLKKIRDEKVFLSNKELIRQIHNDEQKAIRWFAKRKSPLS